MKLKTNAKTLLKNNIYMLSVVWKIKPSRIIFTIIINLINGSLNYISQIFLMQYVINAMTNNIPYTYVLIVAVLVLLYQIFGISLNSYYNAIFCPTCDNIIKNEFQKVLFKKSLSIDLIEYDKPDFYDKFSRAIAESNVRALKIVDLLGKLINCLFIFISISLVIFLLEPSVIVISILPFAFNLIIESKRNKINYEQDFEITKPNRIRTYVRRVMYLKNYAKEIRITNIFNILKKKFNSSVDQCIEITRKYSTKNVIIGLLIPIINLVVVYLGTIVFTSYFSIVKNTLPLADAFVIVRSIWQVSSSLEELSKILSEFHNNSQYVNNLNAFMKYTPLITNNIGSIKLNRFCDNIQFCNVSFKYPNENKFSLKKINFTIHSGEKIAIVGYNGSGKTTLIKLLLRLYEPNEGEIKFDSVRIRDYNIDDYRKMFSTVFQDYEIFAMSILDNILCGNKADTQTVFQSLEVSGLSRKVQKLKEGVNTNLTKEYDENGVVLSVGERQKLALSRAFLKNAPIVVLDEPSSALDPVSEYEMFENVMRICKDKTIIYISHRLSSAILSDRIFMMENGNIVEEGSHKELMIKDGKYACLFKKQAQYYSK